MKLFLSLLGFIIFTCSCQPSVDKNEYSKSWTEANRTYLLTHLKTSLDGILNEVDSLNKAQWQWKENPDQWSIAQVVEHLIVHDELFYRETKVLTGLDKMMPQNDALFSTDEIIQSYREITPQNTGKAPNYLDPLNRWCSKVEAMDAYSRIRNMFLELVKTTNKDLRKFYTSSGRGPTQYRDLHQLLLISVAHTERHLQQIQKIKLKQKFPI